MYDVILDAGKIRGIDNLTDPLAIPPGGEAGTYLVVGVNVDIDDEYRLLRRPGYVRKLVGNFHSAWSNGDMCYVIKIMSNGGVLYRVDDDYSLIPIVISIDPDARMQYVYQNGRTYCTNNQVIGYIEDDVFTVLPGPDDYYQRTMPAGHLIEFHCGRMIVARDDMLYISEAYMPHYYDVRWGWRKMKAKVTMVKSVEAGVFLGTTDGAFFASGKDFLSSELMKITDSAPLLGSAVTIPGDEVMGKGIGGTIYWTSDEGVWRGALDGAAQNITWNHYAPDEATIGSAVAHSVSGFFQYCLIHEIPLEVGDAKVKINMTVPHIESIGA